MRDMKQCVRSMRTGDTWHRVNTRCTNPAKYGDYCGVHSPEQQEKRRKARGPTLYDQEIMARGRESRRVEALERVLEEVRGVTGVLHPCGIHDAIAAYDKLMEDKP